MKTMTFEETKRVELEILLEVAKFCDDHQLKYFLAYGTLIGAVRHKGFIPWDDDIDIQMPREDYDKLIDLCKTQKIAPHLELISPDQPCSRHSFVKIIDCRTLKIEEAVDYKNGNLGVDIDIFPLDGQPDSEDEFERWYEKLQKIYRMYSLNMLPTVGNWKRRIGVPVIKLLFNKRRLKRKADKLHKKYPYQSATYIGTVESSFNSKGNRVLKECYENFVLIDFEGYQFKVPIGYDDILKKLYGNYMELPPKEKQMTHHTNNTFWKDITD